ncbi:hypothetical protein DVH24_000222 [Malus domestica]|uniref:Myb/SANT-like domain-containing protein n=1 Tax=Malus domestica TaxID=3750 RepID=A0A498J444_MALDO|nr:hypothetical protein DVH24_000222 [Malus domestica]
MNTSGFGWDDEKKCVVVDNASTLIKKMKRNDGGGDLASIMDANWDKTIIEMKKLGESFTFE